MWVKNSKLFLPDGEKETFVRQEKVRILLLTSFVSRCILSSQQQFFEHKVLGI